MTLFKEMILHLRELNNVLTGDLLEKNKELLKVAEYVYISLGHKKIEE